METEKIKKVLKELEDQISQSISLDDVKNEKSWNCEVGILLTREEAIICKKILRIHLLNK